MSHDRHTDRRLARNRRLVGAAAVVVALSASACTGPSRASTTASTTTQTATGLVGKRYCEVLLVHSGTTGLYADVYNTYPLNACPPDKWAALDAKALARENQAFIAELNGPRFWLMDSIQKVRSSSEQIRTFGGIAMILEATVQIGPDIGSARAPFTPHTVDRHAAFTFHTGRQVYELVAPDRTAWVMQTYSQIKDPALSPADLPGLEPRLTLPTGWNYRVRTLTAPLVVATASKAAQVLQDNLSNSYSEEPAG